MTEPESNDARQFPRAEALLGAAVLDAARKVQARCLITNFSEDGAELQIAADVRVPGHFLLHVPQSGQVYRAEVRWREPGRIGVMFSGKDERQPPALRAVR